MVGETVAVQSITAPISPICHLGLVSGVLQCNNFRVGTVYVRSTYINTKILYFKIWLSGEGYGFVLFLFEQVYCSKIVVFLHLADCCS